MNVAGQESVYTVLQKAKPTWSCDDLCKVHEKLHKVNVTSIVSLDQMLTKGCLNQMLISAGEKKLKPGTLQQLSYVLRPHHREMLTVVAEQPLRMPGCYCRNCMLETGTCEKLPRVACPSTRPPPSPLVPHGLRRSASATDVRSPLHKVGCHIMSGEDGGASKNRHSRSSSVPTIASMASLESPEVVAQRAAERRRQRQRLDLLSQPRNYSDRDLDDASTCSARSSHGPRRVSSSPPQKPVDNPYVKPVVAGGMRHDDDALDALLRVARGCVQSGRVPASCTAPDCDDMETDVNRTSVSSGRKQDLTCRNYTLTAVQEEEEEQQDGPLRKVYQPEAEIEHGEDCPVWLKQVISQHASNAASYPNSETDLSVCSSLPSGVPDVLEGNDFAHGAGYPAQLPSSSLPSNADATGHMNICSAVLHKLANNREHDDTGLSTCSGTAEVPSGNGRLVVGDSLFDPDAASNPSEPFAPCGLPTGSSRDHSLDGARTVKRPVLRRIHTPNHGTPIFVPASQLGAASGARAARSVRLKSIYSKSILSANAP